jgi:hypothetical protein
MTAPTRWRRIETDRFESDHGDVHECGARCSLRLNTREGVVCPISGALHGPRISVAARGVVDRTEEASTTLPSRRRYDLDDRDVKARLVIKSLRFVLGDRCDADALRSRLAREVLATRSRPTTLEERRAVVNDVNKRHAAVFVPDALVKVVAHVVVDVHSFVDDARVDIQALLCAVLHYARTPFGLRLADGRIVIPPHPLLAAALPASHELLHTPGFESRVATIGINALTDAYRLKRDAPYVVDWNVAQRAPSAFVDCRTSFDVPRALATPSSARFAPI